MSRRAKSGSISGLHGYFSAYGLDPRGLPCSREQAECGTKRQRVRKGVADLHRRAEFSQPANDRHLQALASVDDTTSLGELAARLCRPTRHNGRPVRALNPHAPADAALLSAISRGEFKLNGFRNRDLGTLLFNKVPASKSARPPQCRVSFCCCVHIT
jgi:hypothetical protein